MPQNILLWRELNFWTNKETCYPQKGDRLGFFIYECDGNYECDGKINQSFEQMYFFLLELFLK